MVDNAVNGGAAINQLCDVAGLKLAILPIDLDHPTADFTTGPAMDEQEVIAAMNKGAAALDPACDYLVVGDIGIGNTTSAAALCLARFGADAAGWVGPGSGLDDGSMPIRQKSLPPPSPHRGRCRKTRSACWPRLGGVNWRQLPGRFWRHASGRYR